VLQKINDAVKNKVVLVVVLVVVVTGDRVNSWQHCCILYKLYWI